MGVEEDFYIGDAKAEASNVLQDEGRRARVAAVNQHMALGAGEQEGGYVAGAYIVQVAGNAERLPGKLSAVVGGGLPFTQQKHQAHR